MDVKDIRIDSWVRYKGEDVQVLGIHHSRKFVMLPFTAKDKKQSWKNVDEVNPIFLDDNYFKKLRFRKHEGYWKKRALNFDFLVEMKRPHYIYIEDMQGNRVALGEVQFVHALQDMFYSLANKDPWDYNQ